MKKIYILLLSTSILATNTCAAAAGAGAGAGSVMSSASDSFALLAPILSIRDHGGAKNPSKFVGAVEDEMMALFKHIGKTGDRDAATVVFHEIPKEWIDDNLVVLIGAALEAAQHDFMDFLRTEHGVRLTTISSMVTSAFWKMVTKKLDASSQSHAELEASREAATASILALQEMGADLGNPKGDPMQGMISLSYSTKEADKAVLAFLEGLLGSAPNSGRIKGMTYIQPKSA